MLNIINRFFNIHILKRFFLLFFILIFSYLLQSGDYPIVFLHGHKSSASPDGGGWGTWYPIDENEGLKYTTAMTRIIESGYKGYRAGNPLNCSRKTIVPLDIGNTRVIYNFSYYNPGGGPGVIGDDRIIECIFGIDSRTNLLVKRGSIQDRYFFDFYGDIAGSSNWSRNFAGFIEKVLIAHFGMLWYENPDAKVDVVAHSMGGLVVRFAVKYLNLSKNEPVRNRIRKLLLIATPNHPYEYPNGELIHMTFATYKYWQTAELWEMGVSRRREIMFREVETNNEGKWCDLLGYDDSYGVEVATIAGNRRRYTIFNHLIGPDDGLVNIEQAEILSSKNKSIVFASHDNANPKDYGMIKDIGSSGENSLTECSFTEEFIRKWIIDDREYIDSSKQ